MLEHGNLRGLNETNPVITGLEVRIRGRTADRRQVINYYLGGI
jgi:hypothetical protein